VPLSTAAPEAPPTAATSPAPARTSPAPWPSSPATVPLPTVTSVPVTAPAPDSAGSTLLTRNGPVALPDAPAGQPAIRWSWPLPDGYDVVSSDADDERVFLALSARREEASSVWPPAGRVVALDRVSGQPVWSADVPLAPVPNLGSILAVHDGGLLVVEAADGGPGDAVTLVRRDPASGEPSVLQRRETPWGIVRIVDDQIVFTYGGNGAASTLLDADGSLRWAGIDGDVTGWGATTMTLTWPTWKLVDRATGAIVAEGWGEAIQHGDLLFSVDRPEGTMRPIDACDGSCHLARRDARTGDALWTEPVFADEELDLVAITVTGDLIVAPWAVPGLPPERTFDVAAVSGATGQVRWTADPEACETAAVDGVVDSVVLQTCDSRLLVRDTATGALERTVDLGHHTRLEGVPYGLAAGPLLYTIDGSNVVAAGLTDGESRWSVTLPDSLLDTPRPAILPVDGALLLVGRAGAPAAQPQVWYLTP
jgi:outer membrane protein assembly factor BamB